MDLQSPQAPHEGLPGWERHGKEISGMKLATLAHVPLFHIRGGDNKHL